MRGEAHIEHFSYRHADPCGHVASQTGASEPSLCCLGVKQEDWLKDPAETAWRPLCADIGIDSTINAYGVCATKREVELLTGKRIRKRFQGPRFFKVREEYCSTNDAVLVVRHDEYPPLYRMSPHMPEWYLLKDPLDEYPSAEREYTIVICFFLAGMGCSEESMHLCHQAQRRIMAFVKSLLGKPHPAVRAKALLECKKYCEEIVRQYCPQKDGDMTPYRRTLDEWRTLKSKKWGAQVSLVETMYVTGWLTDDEERRGLRLRTGKIECICFTCRPVTHFEVEEDKEENNIDGVDGYIEEPKLYLVD
ncbi:hypothetical protein P389DRAFT_99916 [Cystobasidium minutum MCA 4210]|uniref:uncharacterized protein n=1 Tax=Cystobasidium minutum MCA 4210 TaxID=1397322 RepID=UPI0034CE2DED|eukprot:jgi/Rhomi1/99916/CE99915_126